MWIVRLALRRPYTFIVMGLTILLLGVFAIVATPTDLGQSVEIVSGLGGRERLVVSAPDGLKDGARITVEQGQGKGARPTS